MPKKPKGFNKFDALMRKMMKPENPPKYDPSRGGKAKNIRYRADFLWKHADGSVEEAGYEFANARTEEYRQQWWAILLERARAGK